MVWSGVGGWKFEVRSSKFEVERRKRLKEWFEVYKRLKRDRD